MKGQNFECLETKQGLGQQQCRGLTEASHTLGSFSTAAPCPYSRGQHSPAEEAFLRLTKDLKVIIEVFFISGSLIPFQALMSPKSLCYTDLALLNMALLFAQKSQKCLFFSFSKKQKPIPSDTQNPFSHHLFYFQLFQGIKKLTKKHGDRRVI